MNNQPNILMPLLTLTRVSLATQNGGQTALDIAKGSSAAVAALLEDKEL